MIDLRVGDCLELMKNIPDNSIDCVITSPPYNKGGVAKSVVKTGQWVRKIAYNSYDDNMPEDEYYKWQVKILDECYRILKSNGSVFYNHKVRRFDNQAHFPKWVFDTKLKFYQMIVWNRNSSVDVNSNYLTPTTELVFWFSKDKPKVFKNNAMYTKEVWEITPTANKYHPAPFPLKLAENCVLLTTEKGDIVLDPFNGIGTTGVACKKYGRNYIGFDIDPYYIKLAEQRINNGFVQEEIKLDESSPLFM